MTDVCGTITISVCLGVAWGNSTFLTWKTRRANIPEFLLIKNSTEMKKKRTCSNHKVYWHKVLYWWYSNEDVPPINMLTSFYFKKLLRQWMSWYGWVDCIWNGLVEAMTYSGRSTGGKCATFPHPKNIWNCKRTVHEIIKVTNDVDKWLCKWWFKFNN